MTSKIATVRWYQNNLAWFVWSNLDASEMWVDFSRPGLSLRMKEKLGWGGWGRKIKCSNLWLDSGIFLERSWRILRIFPKPGENPFSLLTLIIWIFGSEKYTDVLWKTLCLTTAWRFFTKYLFGKPFHFWGRIHYSSAVYLMLSIWLGWNLTVSLRPEGDS